MSGSASFSLKTLLRTALFGWGYTYGYVDGSSLAFIVIADVLRLLAKSDEIVERLYFYIPIGRTERADVYVSIIVALTAVIAWTLDYIDFYVMVFTCCRDLTQMLSLSYHLPGLSLTLIENQHRSPVIIVLVALLPAMCWMGGIAVYLRALAVTYTVFVAARAAPLMWSVGQRRYRAQEAYSHEFYNTLLEHWWNFSKVNLVDFLKESFSGPMEVVSFTSRRAPSLSISSVSLQQLSTTEVAVSAFISFKVEDFHLVARTCLSDYTFKDVRLKGNIQIIFSYCLWTSFPHISNVKILFTDISQCDFAPQTTGFQYLFNPIAELFIQEYIIDKLKSGFDIPIGQHRMSQDPCRVS